MARRVLVVIAAPTDHGDHGAAPHAWGTRTLAQDRPPDRSRQARQARPRKATDSLGRLSYQATHLTRTQSPLQTFLHITSCQSDPRFGGYTEFVPTQPDELSSRVLQSFNSLDLPPLIHLPQIAYLRSIATNVYVPTPCPLWKFHSDQERVHLSPV